jgi:predicted ATPase/DNA-binding SARP family transcriptional activator
MSRWNLHLFGGLSLESDGNTIDQFPTKRSATILARLATSRNGAVSRDELAEELWPEDYLDSTRMRLRQELSRLRSALGDAKDVVEADRTWVRLDLDAVVVDCREVDRLLRLAEHADSQDRGLELVNHACSLVRGPLLPELTEHWVFAARSDYREKLEAAMTRAIDDLESNGRSDEALNWAAKAVRMAPGSENFVVRLARLQVASGNFGQATKSIEDFERLGSPSSDIAELKREIRGLADAALTPMEIAPLRTAFAAETETIPTLPTYLDRFVGRESEISMLLELLGKGGSARCVTLVGPGGVGKTRLSAEIGGRLTATGQAVHFFSLEDVSGSNLSERFADLSLHSGGFLLILDNAESDIDAAAREVAKLVRRSGGVRVLATSRQRLAISGERVIEISPIEVPLATAEFEEIEASPSVRLFLDRARAHSPGFELSPSDAMDIASLMSRLEGLPLAIELAAAKAPSMGVAAMASKLDSLFTMLVTRRRDIPDRQRSVYATIEWSYQSLDDELRSALVAVSVCPAGCAAEVAQVLIGDQAIAMIDELMDRSLIVIGTTESGRIRYRLLEPIRAYVHNQIDPNTREEATAKFALALTNHLAENMQKNIAEREGELLAEIGRESENVLAMLDWSRRNDAELSVHLVAVAWRYYCLAGHRREGYAALTQVLSSANLPTTKHLPVALFGAAYTAVCLGRSREAEEWFQRSAEAYHATGQGPSAAWVTLNMTCVAMEEGDYPKMLEWAGDALPKLEALGNPLGPALAHADIAIAQMFMGEFDLAEASLQRSFQYRTKMSSSVEMARYLFDKAMLAYERSECDEAIRLASEARDEFAKQNQVGLEIDATRLLAEAYVDSSKLDLAVAETEFADAKIAKLGLIHDPAWVDRIRAMAAIGMGDWGEASQITRRALATALSAEVMQGFVEGVLLASAVLACSGEKAGSKALITQFDATIKATGFGLRPSRTRWRKKIEGAGKAEAAESWRQLAANALDRLI